MRYRITSTKSTSDSLIDRESHEELSEPIDHAVRLELSAATMHSKKFANLSYALCFVMFVIYGLPMNYPRGMTCGLHFTALSGPKCAF